ncbi:MAG: tape measure protein [Myxococcales bacterium]|nr:tape measure protein [Myxococcales bacterium]
MSNLTWTLRLVDQISPGALGAMRSLAAVKGQLTAVRSEIARPVRDAFAGRISTVARLSSAGGGLTTRLRGLTRWGPSAAQGLRGLGTAAMLGGGALLGGGAMIGRSIVEQASFRERALTSLRSSLGTTGEALVAFRNAVRIANQTPLDTSQVVDATSQLAGAGFRGNQLTQLLAIGTDIGANNGQQAMESVIRALGQIRSKGRLQAEELMQIREAAPSIAQHLTPALGQVMGFRGDQAAIARQVNAAISAGRVSGDAFNRAFLEAGRRMSAGDGGLGGIAQAQSRTLGGSLSNLSNAWDNLLLSLNGDDGLANMAGLRSFREALDGITSALDIASPRGQRAMRVLEPLINGLFGTIFGGAGEGGGTVIDGFLSGLERATPTILSAVQGIRDFVGGMESGFMAALSPAIELIQQLDTGGGELRTTMRDIGRAVGYLAGAFVLGVGVIGGAIAAITRFIDDLVSSPQRALLYLVSFFTGIPVQLVDGFLGSLRTQWGVLVATVEGLAGQLPESVRRVLGIHSPSRVMMQIGAYTVAGMEEGILSGHGDVERAMARIAAPPSTRGAGAGGGRAPISVQVTVHTAATDAEAVGAAVARELDALFANLFERAALGVG